MYIFRTLLQKIRTPDSGSRLRPVGASGGFCHAVGIRLRLDYLTSTFNTWEPEALFAWAT